MEVVMPIYDFKCECGNYMEVELPMAKAVGKITCTNCGKLAMRNYASINFDRTVEKRDPKSANFWKKSMSNVEQSKVMAGEKNPY